MKWFKTSLFVFLALSTNLSAQITATVYGDAVSIQDANFDWSCGGSFFPEIQIAGDTIMIMEVDTMMLTTCNCQHTVTTLVSGLSAGSYTAKVFRQHRVHTLYPIDTVRISTHYAGSVSFVIGQHPNAAPELKLYQIGCGGSPGKVDQEQPTIPMAGTLECFPNPFNPSTIIRYTVPLSGNVILEIFDMNGVRVDLLVRERKDAGVYEFTYDSRNISSGSYICRLTCGETFRSVKLLLLK